MGISFRSVILTIILFAMTFANVCNVEGHFQGHEERERESQRRSTALHGVQPRGITVRDTSEKSC